MRSAPPGTFVPADDNLFPPVAHGTMWLILGLLAGAVGLALTLWSFRGARRPADATVGRPGLPALKAQYLTSIDQLEQRFEEHLLDERELHHQLSWTVRRFAADLAEPGALAMTPTVLGEAGLVAVSDVVAGYQEPQFKESAESDPVTSVANARALIESW